MMQNDLSKLSPDSAFNETVLLTSYSGDVLVVLPAFMQMIKSLLISGCGTFIAVLGMTSVISYICQQIGYFFQYVRKIIFSNINDRRILNINVRVIAFQSKDQQSVLFCSPTLYVQ